MDERRNFQRVSFAARTEIICAGKKYHCELTNISLRGALVLADRTLPLEEGSRCKLAIHLLDSEIILRFETDIIHRRDNRCGFKFISEDLETAIHLKRLLELNIGSSTAMEKEVARWLKIN